MTLATPSMRMTREAAQGSGKIRTLIVDDQLLAREVLKRMLRNEKDIEIVGTPGDGREAVEAIRRLRPDLVFMDVQMPELNGFEVMAEIGPACKPAVIFVTAEENAAIRAFDIEALDYLLKPCKRERFQIALNRARARLARK